MWRKKGGGMPVFDGAVLRVNDARYANLSLCFCWGGMSQRFFNHQIYLRKLIN